MEAPVTGIGGLWVDGTFWFETGETTRKGRNLARDQRCTLGVATAELDLVVEGKAPKGTDPTTVAELAARWAGEEWPARVDDTSGALKPTTAHHRLERHRGTSIASNLTRPQLSGQRSRRSHAVAFLTGAECPVRVMESGAGPGYGMARGGGER
jgi:Pyridoxamine 5'-phosphate oxidase